MGDVTLESFVEEFKGLKDGLEAIFPGHGVEGSWVAGKDECKYIEWVYMGNV